jgi:glutathione synthase/RimK-type ligase-like ATP-grasp enzyme
MTTRHHGLKGSGWVKKVLVTR